MNLQQASASSVLNQNKKKVFNPQNRFVYFSIIPVMILFFVFLILPITLSVILSFFNYNPLSSNPPFIGLKNYTDLFHDKVFLKSFYNTLYFVIISVALNLVIATMVALAINGVVNRKYKNFFRTIYFLPTTANIAAVAIVWNYLLDPHFGAVVLLLSKLGIDAKIYFVGDPKLAMYTLIAMNLWQDIGYNIVILLAGIEGIPGMFYESALIDGANSVQIFFKVTLPLLVRTMVFVSVMTIISYFQVLTQVMVFTGGGPDHATEVIALNIYLNAFSYSKLGYASAAAIVLLILMLAISLLQIKLVKADWEY